MKIMKVQNISNNYNFDNTNSLNNKKSQNSSQVKYNPSFQQLKFPYLSKTDKDIFDKIANNEEIKKLVTYLEKRKSILEIHIFHNTDEQKNTLYSVSCTYDRHKVPQGEGFEFISSEKKENVIDKLKKFKAAKFIEMIEQKETVAEKKFVKLEQDFFAKEEEVKESLKKGETVLHNVFKHISNFFKH